MFGQDRDLTHSSQQGAIWDQGKGHKRADVRTLLLQRAQQGQRQFDEPGSNLIQLLLRGVAGQLLPSLGFSGP